MGISGGVDNDAVVDPVGGLDGVHQSPFVVGLELGDLSPHFPPRLLLSIDPRLPDPQHIEIGPVQNQNFHDVPPSNFRLRGSPRR